MTVRSNAALVDGRESASRWFGIGTSSAVAPCQAAEEASSQALQGPDPKLVIVFCSSELDVDCIAAEIRALIPDAPMIGCTTAGEISTDSVTDRSVSVAVLGGQFEISVACALGADEDLFTAGVGAAGAIDNLASSEHELLLLLTDGLAGNQEDIVRGAYSHVGAAVPLVGGCAGDGGEMIKTRQIFQGKVIDRGVVSAAIGSDAPMGIGVRHGWRTIGEPLLVTSSSGTEVVCLDNRPALQVYLEHTGSGRDLLGDPDAFAAFARTHPLGLRRRDSEEVRFISGADFETGSLTCIAEVPEGSLVWFMGGDLASVLEGTAASCSDALANLGGREPLGLLMFDCIARRSVLGPLGVDDEMAVVRQVLPSVPTLGFYTYGEIARTHGARGFHNQTLVTLALS